MNQNRIAAGVPSGGQFAAHERTDDTVSLTADLAEAEAAERVIRRRQAVIAMQLVAADVLAEQPQARYLELAYAGGAGGAYGALYAEAILDERGEPIDADEHDPINLAGFDEYVRFVPRLRPRDGAVRFRDDSIFPTEAEQEGYDWLSYGTKSVRVDLHAVRTINPGAIR